MHLHQQSHLYPCQLASLTNPNNNSPKFIFHSPINPYSTLIDPKTNDCEYLDHQQVRYSKLSALQVGQGQRIALLSNSSSISFIGHSAKILHSISLSPQQEIISDITSLPQSFINHSTKNEDRTFSLAYLSTAYNNSEDNTFLTIQKFQHHRHGDKKQHKMNPESEKYINTQEESCQALIHSQQYELSQASSIKLSVPLTRSKRFSSDSIQIKCNQLNHNNKTLALFEKQSSILYTYDPEYQTFTNTILCSQYEENHIVTEYQSNNISFLSQNLIVNSHSNGLIKLIDQRVGAIVHIRNLVEEIALFGERASLQRQQNLIKFWNQDKTCTTDHSENSTSQFVINLKNHIYQVDLRNSRLVKQDSVFKFQSPQQLTNYQIAQSNNQSIFAFTTEGHSNYKAYVVQRAKNL